MYEIEAYQGMLRGSIWTWASCYRELEVKILIFFYKWGYIYICSHWDTEKGLKDFSYILKNALIIETIEEEFEYVQFTIL